MLKPMGEKTGSIPKVERRKVRKMYKKGGAVDGCLCVVVKTGNIQKRKSETIFAIKGFLYKIYSGHT